MNLLKFAEFYINKCNRNDKHADENIYNLCYEFINGQTSRKDDTILEVFFNIVD